MLSIGSITAPPHGAAGTGAALGAPAAPALAGPTVATHGIGATRTASDLQSFLATLNQVLQQSGGAAAHAAPAAATAPGATALAHGLETSFQRLMQDLALNGAGGLSPAQVNAASASAAAAQGSLQAQLANLRNIGQAATSGLMVHTSA